MNRIKPRIAFILQCLVFCIPINIYIIGDWMGVGIQWALVRYQQSYLGSSLISFTNDIAYINSGIIQGRTAIAFSIWALAVFLLIISFILNLLDIQKRRSTYLKNTFLITIITGLLFLLSDFVQYSTALHSAGGLCIPLGIPLIFFIGIMGFWYTDHEEKYSDTKQALFSPKTISSCCPALSNKITHVNSLAILLVVSVLVKIIIFFSSLYAPFDAVTGDIELYYDYASMVASGQIPYLDFSLEYPLFFFIPILIAYIPVLISQNLATYMFSYMAFMYVMDLAMLVCIYFIALNFFGPKKAFLCGFLYATAISAAFYVPITYDIIPIFLLVFSILLYLYGKTMSAYISVASGALAKWFPVLAIPFIFVHGLKNQARSSDTKKGILLSIFLFLVFTIPFVVLNWDGFLFTYTFNLSRDVQTHSLIYYGEVISRFFSFEQNFVFLSFVLLLFTEILLLVVYYRYLDDKISTLFCTIFLSVFFFVILNKNFSASYIVWLTPFLAILLVQSYHRIILFYLTQIIIYVETPLLFRIVYGRGKSYDVLENSLPSFSFVFYTIKFLIFFIILGIILVDLTRNHSNDNHLHPE